MLIKQKCLSVILVFGLCITQNIFASGSDDNEPQETRPNNRIAVINYEELPASSFKIVSEFKRTGYIAISGVPGFAKAYQNLVDAMRAFTALPEHVQAKCTPNDYFARGWSRGVEALIPGKKDTYKGSYYAWFPDNLENLNVWPKELPELQLAYTKVANLILEVGRQILPSVDFFQETRGLGRMLHYKSVPAGEDDGNPNWCGIHRDHGILTGLCPEVYFRNGMPCERPVGSGLYIEGKPVAPPADLMLFQMGEVLELMTGGKVRATDHWVQKPPVGDVCERYALAVFFDPFGEFEITCDNPTVRAKYADRFPLHTSEITYEEWGSRSLAKYNPINLAPQSVDQ